MRRLASVAVLVLLAGCGGGGGGDAEPAESSATTVTTIETTTSTSEDPLRQVVERLEEQRFEAAFEAFKEQYEQTNNRQWGRSWESLHPAQQAIVSKDLFVRCSEARESKALRVETIELVEAFEEVWVIPGTDLKETSVALTVKLTVSEEGGGGEATGTYHLFEVDGTWRFALSDPSELSEETC